MKFEIYTLIFFLFSLILFIKCSGLNDAKDNVEIVKQIDIPWSSLADTPWPMYHHDPQSTGRSKFRGPRHGLIEKRVFIGSCESAATIGFADQILLNVLQPEKLICLDKNGKEIWNVPNSGYCSAIIGSDSLIYNIGKTNFSCMDKGGRIIAASNHGLVSSFGVNVDQKGKLYFIDYNHNLTVIDKNGNLIFQFRDERFLYSSLACPSFSVDGSTIYIQGKSCSLFAFDINSKSIKWNYGEYQLNHSPVIDNNDNIYIIPSRSTGNANKKQIISLNKNGMINWKYEFPALEGWGDINPTIDYDGNIYFGTDSLYSITNKGYLKWKRKIADREFICNALVCDNENTVYACTKNENGNNSVLAILNNGEIKWKIDNVEDDWSIASPAITAEGKIIYVPYENYSGNILMIR